MYIKDRRPTYTQGENIAVRFKAPPSVKMGYSAWLGIVPASIPHGKESVNDRHDVAYQYLSARTEGEMTFAAPQPGKWTFRLHDSDASGREVGSCPFTVQDCGP